MFTCSLLGRTVFAGNVEIVFTFIAILAHFRIFVFEAGSEKQEISRLRMFA